MAQLSRSIVVAAVVAAAGLGQGAALARSATFTRTVGTPRGPASETVTRSFSPSTGVASRSETVTRPDGRNATVSTTSTPDSRGGFTDTRSVKTFGGQTDTGTRQVGR